MVIECPFCKNKMRPIHDCIPYFCKECNIIIENAFEYIIKSYQCNNQECNFNLPIKASKAITQIF